MPLSGALEAIIDILLVNAFNVSPEREALNALSPTFALFRIVVALPVMYLLSRLIGNILHKSYRELSTQGKRKFAAYGFVISVFAYIVGDYRIISLIEMREGANISTLLITAMLIVCVLMMATYSGSEYKNKALKDLVKHNKQLALAYEEIRKYRHDHINVLNSFMGYTDGENRDGFKKHLTETLNYAQDVLNKLDDSTAQLNLVNIPELRGLLSVKFAQALASDIDLEIDISDATNDLPVNRMDLCRMVGIITDNAIEELLSTNEPLKSLKFGILLDGDDTLIVCTNTCTTPPDIEKIFAADYSTKGKNRGLGLYNLKQICDNLENVFVTINAKADEFAVILTIIAPPINP
ncbi:MAG: GHKL domain-containing protein [Defluviitaleaceae bacterium]|nr:GHKL domain-containing protein [Defluviitaleaceae bacterium]